MINRHWVETDGVYELHFEKFGRDEVILKFVQAEDDDTGFWYVSNDLNVTEGDYEHFDSVEEAKEEFEYKYESYLEDQISYYEDLLEQWNKN